MGRHQTRRAAPAPAPRRCRYRSLAEYLARSGETQAQLAARLGISQAHISRIRAGVANPRPKLAWRIADACDVPIESFTKMYFAHHMIGDVA